MDALFKALNDSSRRAILDALRNEDGQTLSRIEARFEMTRFGVMKHLGVLEEAGLVVVHRKGRFKHHYLNAAPLQEMVDRWVEPLLARPAARALVSLKHDLEGTSPMADTPDFVHQTFIRTTRDALWDALTDPGRMAQYHFAASRAEGGTKQGETIRFVKDDGTPMLSQTVRAIEPKSRIELSFEPHWENTDSPPSWVVYRIDEEGPVCKLTCEHYALLPGQEGVREGWARWAAGLKSWLETGEALRAA